MTDRKLLELAPGSRWEGEAVVDVWGDKEFLREYNGRMFVDINNKDDDCGESADASDIIALLHRAGLLDELLAEAWDEGRGKGRQEAYADERGGFVEFQNPYRKDGK